MSRTIRLRTDDDKIFEVDVAVAKEFGTIKKLMEERTSPDATVVLPLPDVCSDSLGKIITYCEQQVDLTKKAAEKREKRKFSEDFVKDLELSELKDLIIAADYLDFNSLLDVLIQKTADRINNKSVKFVRNFLGIKNDLTEEEEMKMINEHPWAFQGLDLDED